MTEHFWPLASSVSPSFEASTAEDPPNKSCGTMRNSDNKHDPGAPSIVPMAEETMDKHPSDRTLRKRKRDVANDPTTAPQEPHLDHTDERLGLPVDPYHQPQPISYNADSTKRVKVEEGATQSVIHPGNRPLVPLDRSQLPGELWQHVFKFVPPHSLGRILRVGKAFKLLLTPIHSELPVDNATQSVLKYVHANSIWATSRKAFHPGMPRPLSSMSELDMWRLAAGTACQFCNKNGSSQLPDVSPWESGPREKGVRIIWPFGVRACGECIQVHCEKEMDLLFSSTVPSLIVPAIPFAFFTSSMNYVSSSSLRGSQPPPGLSLTKFFLKIQIEEMKRKFEEVKLLGPATAEEWIKGLEGNGKERMADAARWEQWELTGGLRALKHPPPNERVSPAATGFHSTDFVQADDSAPVTNGRPANTLQSPPTSNTTDTKLSHPLSPDSDKGYHSMIHPSTRGERSLRQVNEAKVNRRAEIERRCLALDPPLLPSVLNHMDSFTASIQIPNPFTDRDWNILMPRLLSQRDAAERREQERIKQDQLLQAKSEERRQQDAQLREAKEVLDREWEDAQKPVRDRMATYADEIIREGWRGGDTVTKEKCPKFAADVLIYVRDKFYENLKKEDAMARAAGKPIEEDPPDVPPKRKLILENMKWIFDTKIKPLTERHQKELFLCNGCENNTKFYGFEGVVQHYAAKHTSVLSLGSVVVYWRAEWPEQPPFHPNPNAAKALMYAMPRPVMGQPHMYSNQGSMYPHGPDGGHGLPPEGYPQPSPGRFTRTPYGTPYAYGSGPYRPPSPGASQFYPGQQQGYGYPPPQAGYPPNVPPPPPMYGSPYPGPAYQPPPYPPPYGPPPAPQSYNNAYGGSGSHGPRRSGPHNQNSQNPNGQGFGMHQGEIDEIAKNSRNMWNGTSGIKDLPHNVRAQILVHHVVERFADRFSHEPPLSLFADALNRHQQMKPIRNLSGLMCKICASRPDHRRNRSQEHGRSDGKRYTLPALVSHFLSMHGESYDWKADMLALPDDAAVAALVNAPGMDEGKLKLVAAAFSWVFPPPPRSSVPPANTPPIGSDKPASKRADRRHPNDRAQLMEERHPKMKSERPTSTRPGLEVAVDDFPRFVESPPADGKPVEPPRDDEYDPHKPAFVDPERERGYVDDHRQSQSGNHQSSLPIHAKDGRGPSSAELHLGQEPIPHPRHGRSSELRNVETDQSQYAPASHVPGHPRASKGGFNETLAPMDERPGGSVRGVSEDGEVAEARPPPQPQPNTEHLEEMSAAERFLSNFDPGQERGDYNDLSREADRQLNARGRWVDASDLEDRRYHKGLDYAGTAEGSGVGTPGRGGAPTHSWRGHTKSPGSRGFRGSGPRSDNLDAVPPVPPRHADDMTPEPGDVRHGKRNAPHTEPGHQARRPQSRFDRYEAQRQSSIRPRSRSPVAHDPLAAETTYYRDRTPPRIRARQRQSAYVGQPSEPYPERLPHDRPTYSRVPPQGQQYQYVDDPRYAEPSYDGGVDYVPVRVAARERQNPGAYYIERPLQREVPKEYIDYEMEYQQPVYDQPPPGCPPGPVPRDAHGMPGAMPRRSRYR